MHQLRNSVVRQRRLNAAEVCKLVASHASRATEFAQSLQNVTLNTSPCLGFETLHYNALYQCKGQVFLGLEMQRSSLAQRPLNSAASETKSSLWTVDGPMTVGS